MRFPRHAARRLLLTLFAVWFGLAIAGEYAAPVDGPIPLPNTLVNPLGEEVTSPMQPHLKQDYTAVSIPFQILLEPVSEVEKNTLLNQGKGAPLKIGFGRDLPASYQGDLNAWLWWEGLPDGRVAAFSITSPEAKAMRVAFRMDRLPEGAEVRFFSGQDAQVYGPFTLDSYRQQFPAEPVPPDSGSSLTTETPVTDQVFWSPVIEGETVGIEIYLPAGVRDDFSVEVPQIQHLVHSVRNPDEKDLSHIGRSGACNIDVQCQTTNPSSLSAAVAKIVFTADASTYLCTGTLLADQAGSRTPYFMTANHCLSTQAVANTVNSYWFFERAACGGANPTSVTQFSGGASLLATGGATDFTFLELRDSAISALPGIHFAGWSSTNPIGLGMIGVHHPAGDLKKWSQGTIDGLTDYLRPVSGTGTHLHVTWSQGTTEGGSSGSGLFAVTGEHGDQALFVGNLHGGYASCSDQSEPDWYGRFELTYPAVSQWLTGGTASHTLTVTSSGASGVAIVSDTGHGGTTNYAVGGLASGTQVSLTAPASAGSASFTGWQGCSSVSANTCSVTMNASLTVTATYGGGGPGPSSLGDALDAPDLNWSTSGAANWTVDTSTHHYGGSSARSGTITHNQSSCLATTVTGPGTLSFHWKVSSEQNWDFLTFGVNKEPEPRNWISGETDWVRVDASLPVGTHSLNWCYIKDRSLDSGSDAGWVDQVSFSGGTVTPPAAPTANPATGIGSSGFTANWTAVTGASTYYLDVARDAGFTQRVSGYDNRAVGTVTQFPVSGLSNAVLLAAATETAGTAPPAPARGSEVVGPGVREAVRQAASGSAASVATPPLVVFLDDGMSGQAATAATAAAAVRNVQKRVLDAMQVSGDRGPGLRIRQRFTHLPVLTVEIADTQTLDQLARQPEVIRIDLDVGGSATMNQIVPLVGADVAHASGAIGSGVTVAVIDSGIDRTHADFAGALVHEECFGHGYDDTPICDNGTARQSGPGSAPDRDGHGTHVSGIIAGRGAVAPLGMAPGARLVAIKGLDDNGVFWSFTENVVAPLDWIIANHTTHGIRLVNASLGTEMSFSGDCDNETAWTMAGAAAVNRLRDLGVTVIVAAGNESRNGMDAPACLSNVISVGASDNQDRATSFTNASPATDVFAPGNQVLSSAVGGGATRMSGTSMASPVVAGCAALLLGAGEVSTPAALETRLKTSARTVTAFGRSYPRVQCGIRQAPPPPGGEVYYYRVRAANDAGTSRHSNVIEVSLGSSDEYYPQVITMFIGYFGRPPGSGGLNYYADLLRDSRGNYLILVDDFFHSEESQAIYGGLSTREQVRQVFQQLFGRDPAQSGLDYWSGQVSGGAISLAEMAYTIAYHAGSSDALVLAAKRDAALAFTLALNSQARTSAYAGALSLGRTYLACVRSPADASAAIARLETTMTNLVAGIASYTCP